MSREGPPTAEEVEIDRIARMLHAAWANAEPDHGVTKHPTSYWATFADMARAVIAVHGLPPLDVDAFRASERARMAPMREAARKEAFVQGYLRARADAVGHTVSEVDDRVLLGWVGDADPAYAEHCARRGAA